MGCVWNRPGDEIEFSTGKRKGWSNWNRCEQNVWITFLHASISEENHFFSTQTFQNYFHSSVTSSQPVIRKNRFICKLASHIYQSKMHHMLACLDYSRIQDTNLSRLRPNSSVLSKFKYEVQFPFVPWFVYQISALELHAGMCGTIKSNICKHTSGKFDGCTTAGSVTKIYILKFLPANSK